MSGEQRNDLKVRLATKSASMSKESSSDNMFVKDSNISNVADTRNTDKTISKPAKMSELYGITETSHTISQETDTLKSATHKMMNAEDLSKAFENLQLERPAVKVLGTLPTDASTPRSSLSQAQQIQHSPPSYGYSMIDSAYPPQYGYPRGMVPQTSYMYLGQNQYYRPEDAYLPGMWNYPQTSNPYYQNYITGQSLTYAAAGYAHQIGSPGDWSMDYAYQSTFPDPRDASHLQTYGHSQPVYDQPKPVHTEPKPMPAAAAPLMSFSKKPPKSILRNWSVPGYDGIPTNPIAPLNQGESTSDTIGKKKTVPPKPTEQKMSFSLVTSKPKPVSAPSTSDQIKLESEAEQILKSAACKPKNSKMDAEFEFSLSDFERERVQVIAPEPEVPVPLVSPSNNWEDESPLPVFIGASSNDPRVFGSRASARDSLINRPASTQQTIQQEDSMGRQKSKAKLEELKPKRDATHNGTASRDASQVGDHEAFSKSVPRLVDRSNLTRGSSERKRGKPVAQPREKVKWQRKIKTCKYFWFDDAPIKQAFTSEELESFKKIESGHEGSKHPSEAREPTLQVAWEYPMKLSSKIRQNKKLMSKEKLRLAQHAEAVPPCHYSREYNIPESPKFTNSEIAELTSKAEFTRGVGYKIYKIEQLIGSPSENTEPRAAEPSQSEPSADIQTTACLATSSDSTVRRSASMPRSCIRGTRAAMAALQLPASAEDIYVREFEDRQKAVTNPLVYTMEMYLQMLGLDVSTSLLMALRDKIETASSDFHFKQTHFSLRVGPSESSIMSKKPEFSVLLLESNIKLIRSMMECNARVQVHSSNVYIPSENKISNETTANRLRGGRYIPYDSPTRDKDKNNQSPPKQENERSSGYTGGWVSQKPGSQSGSSNAESKLTSMQSAEKYRKRPCNLYHGPGGSCSRGHHCLFIHDGRFHCQFPPDNTILQVRLEDYGPEPPEGYVAFYDKKALKFGFSRKPGRRSEGGDGRGIGCETLDGEQPIYYRADYKVNIKLGDNNRSRSDSIYRPRMSDADTAPASDRDRPETLRGCDRSRSAWTGIESSSNNRWDEGATLGKRPEFEDNESPTNAFQQGGFANAHTSRWAAYHSRKSCRPSQLTRH